VEEDLTNTQHSTPHIQVRLLVIETLRAIGKRARRDP
jgi:hypothetical protein